MTRSGTDQVEVYQIIVEGQLAHRWSDWFDGFTLTQCGPFTRLTGPVADQAALYGLLARLRDLRLPLLMVRRLKAGENDEIPPDWFEACKE